MRDSREAIVTLSAAGKLPKRWRGQAGAAAFDSLLEMLALLQPGKSLPAEELQNRAGVASGGAVRKLFITTREHRLQSEGEGPSVSRDSRPLGKSNSGRGTEGTATRSAETFVATPEALSRYFVDPFGRA
jgi:hypothetical protein